jgi:RNA polymerase sigma-70 factor (ECF subfamily)
MAMSHPDAQKADLELAAAASRGNRDAQRRIVMCLMDRVRNTAVYLGGRGPDAEDLAQLALMEVLRALPNYEGRGSLEGWATKVAARSVCAELRRRAQKRKREPGVSEPLAQVSFAPEPELDACELRCRLADVLGEISEHKRVALVLKLVHGHTVEEIAEITGVPFETVRSRLRHARSEFVQRVQRDPELARRVEEASS